MFKLNVELVEKIQKDIYNELNSEKFSIFDYSDLGNVLGIVIGKYIVKDTSIHTTSDFIAGIKHGISLIDGTH